MAGYVVAAQVAGARRYIAQDLQGWHTTGRKDACIFTTRDEAEKVRHQPGFKEYPTSLEWVGPEPEPPAWLVAGELVSLPGGPFWTVYKVEGNEVHLTPPEGGPACVWGLELFLGTWSRYTPTRFDREDPV